MNKVFLDELKTKAKTFCRLVSLYIKIEVENKITFKNLLKQQEVSKNKIITTWRSDKLPYFIKDNFTADNNGVLQFNGKTTSKSKILSPKEQAKIRHAKRTQKQIEDIKARWRDRQEKRSPLNEFCEIFKDAWIDYNDVKLLNRVLEENNIIKKIGRFDTEGSCVSQAFTYVGNKCGYDVVDNRGGVSRYAFASYGRRIAQKMGAMSETSIDPAKNALKLIGKIQNNKEYILMTGYHAAVIRKNKEGQTEYLELQDKKDNNGWKELTSMKLLSRFDCRYEPIKENGEIVGLAEETSYLLDTDLLKNDLGFRRLLGYLNTQR